MEYVEIEGKRFEVSGYKDGLPVIKARCITKDEGFDENGNPKRSVEVIVPCVQLGAQPGNNS